jgi:hypothetical protein
MFRLKQIIFMAILAVVLLAAFTQAQQGRKPDVWKPLKFFVGSWEGKGEGRSGVSKVEREYKFVLEDNFLEAKSRSVYEKEGENRKEKVHEDWGLFSYDKDSGKIMFRQFHTEGFVNRYALDSLSTDGKTLVFVTETIENFTPGWMTRLTYRISKDDEFTETFEIAPPDQPFELYSTNHFKRKK